jgi:hypothetical protein
MDERIPFYSSLWQSVRLPEREVVEELGILLMKKKSFLARRTQRCEAQPKVG